MIANLFGRLLCIGKKVNLSCRFILEQIMLSKEKIEQIIIYHL